MTSTISVPISADEKRQPNEFMPNTHSPNAIIHFPTSGWTTLFGSSVNRSAGLVSPALISWSASLSSVDGSLTNDRA
jgi:hypothetical protein